MMEMQMQQEPEKPKWEYIENRTAKIRATPQIELIPHWYGVIESILKANGSQTKTGIVSVETAQSAKESRINHGQTNQQRNRIGILQH